MCQALPLQTMYSECVEGMQEYEGEGGLRITRPVMQNASQTSEKEKASAITPKKQKFRSDLSDFLLADKGGRAARDVCLELGNSQQTETLLFKCKKAQKKQSQRRLYFH